MAARLDPTTRRRFQSVAGVTHHLLPRPPSTLIPRNNYHGNIPRSFSTASLGFYNRNGNRRSAVWHPKVFAPQSYWVGKAAAMNWGVSNELTAIERYKIMTGNHVSVLGFPARSPSSGPPQRSEEWFTLRRDRLTTSVFSTALGFWNRNGNSRSALWHQKVFPARPDEIEESAAAAAMNWGSENEIAAIDRYKSLTGNEVRFLGFAAHAETGSGWLGASPDGLVGGDNDGGILEVKCPYNNGRPEMGSPWRAAPYYYMPQVQGQMEIMDREWVDLYCWMPSGSALFRVVRDREYWEMMHGMLRDFWWGRVVPARRAAAEDGEAAAMDYEPEGRHGLTEKMIARSRKMAEKAEILCRDEGGRVEFFH